MVNWFVFILVLSPVVNGVWQSSSEDRRVRTDYRRNPRELRRHFHAKRHMMPDSEPKKRSSTLKPMRELRKKPSGHLTPLEDDDIENDQVVSVAIGPPPIRVKFDKTRKKQPAKPNTTTSTTPTTSVIGIVKDLINELSKEFLTKDVNENFVFGQYVGNSMRNLTSDLRLSMQHEVLELIVKYQRMNRGDLKKEVEYKNQIMQVLKDEVRIEKKSTNSNDTDETWPDFTNLAKIVG